MKTNAELSSQKAYCINTLGRRGGGGGRQNDNESASTFASKTPLWVKYTICSSHSVQFFFFVVFNMLRAKHSHACIIMLHPLPGISSLSGCLPSWFIHHNHLPCPPPNPPRPFPPPPPPPPPHSFSNSSPYFFSLVTALLKTAPTFCTQQAASTPCTIQAVYVLYSIN